MEVCWVDFSFSEVNIPNALVDLRYNLVKKAFQ